MAQRSLNGLSSPAGVLSSVLFKQLNLGDIPNPAQARQNLGLVGAIAAGNYLTISNSGYSGTTNEVISANASTNATPGTLCAYDNSGNVTVNGLTSSNITSRNITTSNVSCATLSTINNQPITVVGTIKQKALNIYQDQNGHSYTLASSKLSGAFSIYDDTTASTVFQISSSGVISGNGNGITGITATQIPSLDASKITSGTFTTTQIPNLDASKITSGNITNVGNINFTGVVTGNGSGLTNLQIPLIVRTLFSSSVVLTNGQYQLVTYTFNPNTFTHRFCIPYTYITGDTMLKVTFSILSNAPNSDIVMYTSLYNEGNIIGGQLLLSPINSVSLAVNTGVFTKAVMNMNLSTLGLTSGTRYFVTLSDLSPNVFSDYRIGVIEIIVSNKTF